MATSAKDRMAAVRDRRKALGLRQVLVWVPSDHVEDVRAFAGKLCARFEAAQAAKVAPAARTVAHKAPHRPVRPPQVPPERSPEEIAEDRIVMIVAGLKQAYEENKRCGGSIKGSKRMAEQFVISQFDRQGWPRDLMLKAKKRLNWP